MTANKVIAQAQAWLGRNESDGSFKEIINVYNSAPLARGYALKLTDEWCAAFVSAVAIKTNCADIIPTECSCPKMIELFKKLGSWIENENRTPAAGEIIFYDWEDNGKGDNQGKPNHVGIVEKVSGNTIYVIEGNYSRAVKRRTLKVNGQYIRGYGVPKYAQEPQEPIKNDVCSVKLDNLKRGSKSASVKALQILLIGYGFSCGDSGADGSFGPATEKAFKAFQKSRGLAVDGDCGPLSWAALLGA